MEKTELSLSLPARICYANSYMRRFGLILFCLLALASVSARAGIYTLTDGTKVDGEPIAMNDNGVIFQAPDGTDLPRVVWDSFTQESLRALLAQAKTQREKEMIAPLIEEPPQARAQRMEITVKPIEIPPRPTTGVGIFAMFSSSVGMIILLILYGANLYASYEVAIYRNQPLPLVMGLAAIPVLGVFSPIAFIAMPNRTQPLDWNPEAQTRFQATPPPSDAPAALTAPPPEDVPVAATAEHAATHAYSSETAAAPAAASALPEPIVFKRGEYTFNRRFFETKLAGFFRLVPGEAEKDMVIFIQSGRGDFRGKRITKISPTELYLQIFHDNATADEMIPFVEILEVQVRHKDMA